MKIPITQSRKWQQLQGDLGEKSFFETGNHYQFLAIKKSTPIGTYLYLPYGPVAEDQKSFKTALKAIDKLAREERAIFVRIEPQNPTFKSALPSSAVKVKDLSPGDTWILDLAPDEKTLIHNFAQGTRTRYNTYAKKGLVVESTRELNEISHLTKLQDKLFKSKNLSSYGETYLKTELAQPFATLYLVKYRQASDENRQSANKPDSEYPADGQVLAASLFFDFDGTRYYMQSAADETFKKLPATVALLTTAIFDAKAKGAKNFDFWGIAPDDADSNHPWYGFTAFKKSFGGESRHYLGTYDIITSRAKYRIYTITRKLNRLLRKA